MLLLGGAVTVSDPDPTVKDIPTKRWSMSKAWVEEPGHTKTTWEMLAALGVETVNCSPHVIVLGALPMVGLVARTTLLFASLVNR